MFLSWARQKPAVLSNHLNQPSLRRLLVYETQSKPGNHHITQSGWRRFVQGLAAGGVLLGMGMPASKSAWGVAGSTTTGYASELRGPILTIYKFIT